MNESLLYGKLEVAVKYCIQPEDILVLIDNEPVINTLKDRDKEAFLMADLVIEEKFSFDIKNAKHIIYWKVKEEESSVKITGIAWMNDSKNFVFSGEILKP